jgi:two-component system, OmpR family, sensor kinase
LRPLGRYVRARLHRRIFLWFGASILFTCVAVAIVMSLSMSLSGRTGTNAWYAREIERVRALTTHVFARVWDSPAERDAIAQQVADDLEVSLILTSADQRQLASFGPPCRAAAMTASITAADGSPLGSVAACARPERWSSRGRGFFIAPLFVLFIALWAASGAIARRISRPLWEVARVAQEIGAGKLSSRVHLRRGHHGEVGVVADAMNDMASRIEQQMADQRELLAAVSHELRTPLSRLRLLTELARDNGSTGSTLDEIDREVMEIDALVGDLLASSRIDFAALARRSLDAAAVASRALERAGLDAALLEVPSSPLLIEADATLLARALANLLDNAQKHGGGVARLRLQARGERVAFEVEDDGPGLVAGEESRIFEPFYRRERGGRDAGSLGLGLALVKRIAEAHGGRVLAENRESGGARVAIEIPIFKAA